MQKVNWGIIGLGSVANEFAKGFFNLNSAKILSIASTDKKKINDFKKKFNIPNNFCFDNYDKLLEQKKIDIVYIALPTFLHKTWIINSLNNKKNTLVEKPAVMNSQEILEIKKHDISESHFFEAYMYLFHPQILKTLELIKQGEIGELISMESYFGSNLLTKKNWFGFTKKKNINPNKRIFNKEMGGGAILDLGCYPVSFSTKIASLKSPNNFEKINLIDPQNTIGFTGVEVDSYVTIKFDNNFTSKIAASFSRDLGKRSVINGSKGKIIIEDTWTSNPSKIILKKNNELVFNFKSEDSIYSYEIDALSKFIKNKKSKNDQVFDIDQSIINMKIIDQWKNKI